MPNNIQESDIAKNVAKKTEKISKNKSAQTETLAQHKSELIDFLDSLPSAIRAQTLALTLVQIVPKYIYDEEEAKEVISVFRSKPFLKHLKGVIDEQGIEGALDEMAQLDLDNDAEAFAMFTGEQLSDDEIADLFSQDR